MAVREVGGPFHRGRAAKFPLLAAAVPAALGSPVRLLDTGPLGHRFGIVITPATIIRTDGRS